MSTTEFKAPIDRPDIRMNDSQYRSYQRYVGKKLLKEGSGMVLPGGVVIDGRPWNGFKRSVHSEGYVMNSPKDLLKEDEVDPRCEYCWRPREDPKHSTEALVRSGRLIQVDFDRVDTDSPLAPFVYSYSGAGPDGEVIGFVACGNMALFEVPPREAYIWYQEPVDSTFAALRGLPAGFDERAQDWAERQGFTHEGSSHKVDEKTIQTVEQEKRHPIRGGPQFDTRSKG